MSDLLVTFVTEDKKYAIPSVPFNLKNQTTIDDLGSILKASINENNEELELNSVEFDYMINEKLLRTETIQQFIDLENLETENEIKIEYFVKFEPPSPYKSFSHEDWVSSVDIIDGWILSGCYNSTAHIWNAKSGEHKIMIQAHQSSIKAVQWQRNRNNSITNEYLFVTCSHDETAVLWKWDSKKNNIEHIFTYMGHCRSVDCVDISNRDNLIATGSFDHLLKVWSIEDDLNEKKTMIKQTNKLRSPIITLEGHREGISGCVWLSGHECPVVATASLDQTIKIWDIELGQTQQTLTSSKPFLDIDSNGGLLITGSCDRHVRLWDIRQKEGIQVKNAYTSHQGWVSSVAWSSSLANPGDSNHFVSGSYDNTVKQWDLRSTSAPLFDLLGHRDKVMDVNWNNLKMIISGGADNQIKTFTFT